MIHVQNIFGDKQVITIGSRAMQQARRRHKTLPNGTGYHRGEYMPEMKDDPGAPHAFLVEQDPNTTILSHFHKQNQFQIIVGGGGLLGRHEVVPLLVHYAGAYTGYGPIVCGPQGVQYLTLRPRYDPGAEFMPEARELMVRGPKKHFSSEPIVQFDADALRAVTKVQHDALLPLEEDGLAASFYRLPPQVSVACLSPATGQGQYILVAGGSLQHAGQSLQPYESVYLTPDEPAFNMTATDDGAEVLLLQFPPLAEAYQGVPS